tara:strand:+ start:432 stop:1652 length:1221 start_codon:yes stop_codon:yes gene_type:complete
MKLKKFIVEFDFFQNKINVLIYSIFFLFLLHIFAYYYSFSKIVNLWSFIEAHINYSSGFIRRGLFGEILILLENNGLNKKIFFSTFFFIIYLFQLIFAFLILKKIKNNLITVVFLLSPVLFLFPLFDFGAYQRLDSFLILTILVHTYLTLRLKISLTLEKYKIIINYLLIPLIFLFSLLQEITLLSIPFHMILFFRNLSTKNEEKIIKNYFFFILPIFLFFYFLFSNTNENDLDIIYNSIKDKSFIDPIVFKVIFSSLKTRFILDFLHMITPLTNLLYYIFLIFFFSTPFIFLFFQMPNIERKKINNYILISSFLFLAMFIVGKDWGRWFSIIIFIFMSFYIILLNEKNFKVVKNFKLSIFLVLFIIFQISFTKMPHCCNAYEKGSKITFIGGLHYRIINIKKLIN